MVRKINNAMFIQFQHAAVIKQGTGWKFRSWRWTVYFFKKIVAFRVVETCKKIILYNDLLMSLAQLVKHLWEKILLKAIKSAIFEKIVKIEKKDYISYPIVINMFEHEQIFWMSFKICFSLGQNKEFDADVYLFLCCSLICWIWTFHCFHEVVQAQVAA